MVRYLGVSLKFMGFLVCVFSHIMLFFCFFNVIGHAGFFWHMFFFFENTSRVGHAIRLG